jgi:pyridoxine 5-phosphate synthase
LEKGDGAVRLAVNIDHVATLREARGELEPDPITAARICERAGAKGIVCHLREDRRHINDRDVRLLRKTVKTKLDLEMAAAEEIIRIAADVQPDLATLVPERRQELTTEGGLDVKKAMRHLSRTIDKLHNHDILVSLFVDPASDQVKAAAEIGADFVEIHTGEYANARTRKDARRQFKRVREMAEFGRSLNLRVNAGHGLNYVNTRPIATIDAIEEVSIGHAIISHAVYVGLHTAVSEMAKLVKGK